MNFGYQKVSAAEKTERVGAVFRAVAKRYDVMNDIMSWVPTVSLSMVLHMSGLRQGHRSDLAGGTGDMAALFADAGPEGEVVLADLNEDMMRVGRIDCWMMALHKLVLSPPAAPFPTNSLTVPVSALACVTLPTKTKRCASCCAYLNPALHY